jgi:multisubunit Na+/H+ antiporter MnhE subunit
MHLLLFFVVILVLATISRGFRYFALICGFCFSALVGFANITGDPFLCRVGLFFAAVFGIWLFAMIKADSRQPRTENSTGFWAQH